MVRLERHCLYPALLVSNCIQRTHTETYSDRSGTRTRYIHICSFRAGLRGPKWSIYINPTQKMVRPENTIHNFMEARST